MKKRGMIVTAVFFGMVMLFPWISLLRPSVAMEGAFEETARPELTKQGVWDGSWQSDAGSWFSENMPGREYLIRTKNQLVYQIFHDTPAPRVVIGKKDVLFSRSVLNLWYQLTGPTTDAFVEELGKTIEEFDALMQKQGMKMMIFITPSKARYYEAYVPDLFCCFAAPRDPEKTAYEKLKTALEPMDIPVFDSIEWLEERREGEYLDGLPLFNTTGMHWTRTTAAKVGAALGDSMEEQLGVSLPEMEISVEEATEPEYPDADLAGIMNMYATLTDQYTRPVITVTDVPEDGAGLPAILCRGGSFMGQSLAQLIVNGYFSKDVYMENTQYFTGRFTQVEQFTEYEQVDLREAFQDIDLVLLEVNEASVDVMGFGFMEYVLEHQAEIFPEEMKE